MKRDRGFTLLELLVVMALLSGVMLALGASMRTMARTEERIDARLARTDEFRVATSFIRSTLGRVSARRVVAVLEPGARPFLFVGEPNGVAWVGVMPARHGAGGRYFFKLAVEPINGVPSLAIRFAPWADVPQFPDWSQADLRVLASGVRAFSIRYEDIRVNPPAWADSWTIADRLPEHLVIALESDSGAWPDLVVPLRVLSGSDPRRSGGPVLGGS